jgi:RNA polymerase sigma-70 factor, ECF subfamily
MANRCLFATQMDLPLVLGCHIFQTCFVYKVLPMQADPFETHRPAMLSVAYRMLGDLARAEDAVQDAWIRWQRTEVQPLVPKAYLLTTVTRLCLDELGSARARKEESRSDRLPEPVDLEASGLGRAEIIEQISMAFLVLLQRLTPAERAVLILHEIFDLQHNEIAPILGNSAASSRQLLKRAKSNLASEKRNQHASAEEHKRVLSQFLSALASGDTNELFGLLAEDAVLVVDPGAQGGKYGKLRNIGRPVVGPTKIAAMIQAFLRQDPTGRVSFVERQLNGQPAMLAILDSRVLSAMLLSVVDGKIHGVFFQNDPERLQRLEHPSG